jgi:hypothetical protein
MKPKILPIVWYGTAFSTFAGVAFVFIKVLTLKPIVAIAAAWLASVTAALLVGSVVVNVKPDLRFCTKQQVDGLGYVHQPMSVIVYMTLIALSWGAVLIFKR